MASQTIKYFISLIKEAKNLKQREREILIRRLKGKTLSYIGKKYKLTGERIRQIENKALDNFKEKAYQLFLFKED